MTFKKLLAVAAASVFVAPVANADQMLDFGNQVNDYLAASGANYRLEYMEYYTAPDSGETGNTVFFNDRGNKQIQFAQFAPNDFNRAPWSNGDPNSIDWSYNTTWETGDVSPAEQKAAHVNAMNTWNSQRCSAPMLAGSDVAVSGWVLAFFTGGFYGSFDPTADIMHNGFMPAWFFDALAPGGSNFILGVSFSFQFQDDNGIPVDSNRDGYPDKAFADNYYNDAFGWNIGNTYDIETVVLHEAGHGMGQAHFGSAFLSGGNGKLHFNPRAVMNAAYSGVQTSLAPTDKAGHCAGWGSWPNK